jgi:hypothetical protein
MAACQVEATFKRQSSTKGRPQPRAKRGGGQPKVRSQPFGQPQSCPLITRRVDLGELQNILKAAKAPDLTIPGTLLATADEVLD